jgi:hypothetical protein
MPIPRPAVKLELERRDHRIRSPPDWKCVRLRRRMHRIAILRDMPTQIYKHLAIKQA